MQMIGTCFGRYFTYCTVLTGLSLGGAAQAQTIFMESAQINGTAGTIRVTRLPVQDAVGNITYKNITLPFSVSATGVVTLNTAGVRIIASPTILANTFKPGKYKEATDSYTTYTVGTPGPGPGGRVTTTISGRYFNATWISGPITGHPYEPLLKPLNLPASGQNWGIVGYESYSYWANGDIVSATQTGDTITLTNYGKDNIPDTTLNFILCPTC